MKFEIKNVSESLRTRISLTDLSCNDVEVSNKIINDFCSNSRNADRFVKLYSLVQLLFLKTKYLRNVDSHGNDKNHAHITIIFFLQSIKNSFLEFQNFNLINAF